MEMLTLSGDQRWAAEPGVDFKEQRAEEGPLCRCLPSIYPFSPY